ncbi:hypothetical protein [Catellatospora citrea]|uniref:PIN domain-containing protein n=1 Tax=Catellatospora citrea TaxID=53366 RepID=A0A8J3P268_9ACTN|nr:hypothetical protein [Catellatospora citrea]RKE12263.1 hypothetical protein C8E86_7201 [Catellatospora citrea]GIG00768.1 hypothetical protein Cci01nite_58610 [Catellatospora citrea]
MNITVVLDTSALRAYARLDSVSVGELLQTVAEDGDLAGIPVLVLVDLWPDLGKEEQNLVTDLIARADSPVQVLPMHTDLVPAVAASAREIGHGQSHAVAVVQDLGATLATFHPDRYTGILDPYDVLELS